MADKEAVRKNVRELLKDNPFTIAEKICEYYAKKGDESIGGLYYM